MARTALITGQLKRVVHPDDTDGEPTVYVIQALSRRASAYIKDHCISTSSSVALGADGQIDEDAKRTASVSTKVGTMALMNTEFGLVDIENLTDPQTGQPAEIGAKRVVDLGGKARWTCINQDALDLLTDDDITWLGGLIRDFAKVEEYNAKKSGK